MGNRCFWSEGWSACARYWHRCRTWAHNLCLGSDWPDGHAAEPRAKLHQGFNLIPVSGVSEVVGEEKIGRTGVEGMFSQGMTDDKTTGHAKCLEPFVWSRAKCVCLCARAVRCQEQLKRYQNRRKWCKRSCEVQRHGKSCEEMRGTVLRIDKQNKTIEQLYEVSTPCLDDNQFQKEDFETAEKLSKVWSQIARNTSTWHALVDQTFCVR